MQMSLEDLSHPWVVAELLVQIRMALALLVSASSTWMPSRWSALAPRGWRRLLVHSHPGRSWWLMTNFFTGHILGRRYTPHGRLVLALGPHLGEERLAVR